MATTRTHIFVFEDADRLCGPRLGDRNWTALSQDICDHAGEDHLQSM